jgi:thiamine pyrophosphate-dependent acetolactate synthase large subunit-like protein
VAPATFSILLPAGDDVGVTLRALQAIARLPEGRPFEVLIDVAADDVETRMLVDGLEGDVRALYNPSPTGYGDAFDRLAATATTATLVLLTATAVPADGWSEALLSALEEAGAPAVLPRSLSADGAELAEAHWLALAVRTEAYASVGGFAGTRAAGRAEKASLLAALGTVATAPAAVFLQS